MTNSERIQANNAELRECIDIAESLPEVDMTGASNVVNMDSCTVVTDVPSKTNYYICRETVSNGAITYNITKSYTDANITQSVRCDSTMYIVAGTIKGAVVTDGEVLRVVSGQGLVYKTPSTSGVKAQITLSS